MLYVVIGVIGLIVLLVVIKAAKNASKNKAARHEAEAKEEEKRLRQEEEKKRIEEDNQRRALQKLEAMRAASEKEAAIQAAIQKVPGSEKYRIATRPDEVTSSLLGITEFTPISKKQFVAFDTETTGRGVRCESYYRRDAQRSAEDLRGASGLPDFCRR